MHPCLVLGEVLSWGHFPLLGFPFPAQGGGWAFDGHSGCFGYLRLVGGLHAIRCKVAALVPCISLERGRGLPSLGICPCQSRRVEAPLALGPSYSWGCLSWQCF